MGRLSEIHERRTALENEVARLLSEFTQARSLPGKAGERKAQNLHAHIHVCNRELQELRREEDLLPVKSLPTHAYVSTNDDGELVFSGCDERDLRRLAALDITPEEFSHDIITWDSCKRKHVTVSTREGLEALLSRIVSVSRETEDDEIAKFLMAVLNGDPAPMGREYFRWCDDSVITPEGLSLPITIAGTSFRDEEGSVVWEPHPAAVPDGERP